MASQTEQQIFTINILPDTSLNKENQTMKFGQYIEYNMRNIFLEKSCTKFAEEASHKPFRKT